MKHALITFGNEESYGLSFVGGELLNVNQNVRFFEGEENWLRIAEWKPDFLMFSPLTTFYPKALRLAESLKRSFNAITVFGGHHAFATPEIIREPSIDAVVVGPVRGSIERILNGEKGIIRTEPTSPADMPRPARREYYRDIPRVGKRYRKFALSMLGCPWNCSYCSSAASHIKTVFGSEAHKRYFLTHRPLKDVIDEVKSVAEYGTHEIEWVDDDIFAGDEEWLMNFIREWEKISLPMYISTTSVAVLYASDALLAAFAPYTSAVGMGIQAIRPESLKLFNRCWDNEQKMKDAYDRLVSFGFRVNLQAIVGLPIADPIEDAIETVLGMARIGPGSICSCYPLQIYPGTKMHEYCTWNDIGINPKCNGDTNSAIPAIDFPKEVTRQLRNICKLATFFVKYNVGERWIRALIKMDFDEKVSQELSMLRYRECVVDRLGEKGERIFNNILSTMKLRY